MMKTKNKYLLNKRLKILKFAKIVVAKDGLTSNTFKNISKKYDLNIDEMNLLFPGGKNDFLQFVLEQLNIDLENYCKKLDLIRLPVHKRIRKIMLSKIYIMEKEQILGLISHALTVVGGELVAKGYIEEDVVPEAVGAIVALIGVVWSYQAKKK